MHKIDRLESMVRQQARVLIISGSSSAEIESLINFDLFQLQFEFVSDPSPNGLSAWIEQTGEKLVKVNVVEDSRSLNGGFSQQALNRVFGQIVLKQRIDAVVVVGLAGCTVDIPRVASLIGIPSIVILDESEVSVFATVDELSAIWIRDALDRTNVLICKSDHLVSWQQQLPESAKLASIDTLSEQLSAITDTRAVSREFDYATYEFCLRDHPLLSKMQQADTVHFQGCQKVLDLGCGSGIFLDLLRKNGINASGVERDPSIAEYGRGLGLDIITDDALDFLQNTTLRFDGIYCSHFVEHLPFEAVQKLISLLATVLEDNGLLILVFPDPESIRSQLLGFWRDPEHVRFYHPELVTSLAQAAGLQCEWSSYDDQPHRIVPFEEEPPSIDSLPETSIIQRPSSTVEQKGSLAGIFEFFGLVSSRKHEKLQHDLLTLREDVQQLAQKQNKILAQLENRTNSLWAVNRTWAWNDNAILRLRKK